MSRTFGILFSQCFEAKPSAPKVLWLLLFKWPLSQNTLLLFRLIDARSKAFYWINPIVLIVANSQAMTPAGSLLKCIVRHAPAWEPGQSRSHTARYKTDLPANLLFRSFGGLSRWPVHTPLMASQAPSL